MALPEVRVRVTADTKGAEAGLDRVGDAAQRAQTRVRGFGDGAGGASRRLAPLTSMLRNNSNAVRNAAFQFQDLTVQMQMGAGASRALSMQLPQLFGGFGTVGAVVGLAAGLLIPFAARLFESADGASSLDDALGELEGGLEALKGPLDVLQMDLTDLVDTYGRGATQVREFALAQAEIVAAQAERRLSDQVSIVGKLANEYRRARDVGPGFVTDTEKLAETFGIAGSEATDLFRAFVAFDQAGTFDQQETALERILSFMTDNNVELSKLPPELQTAISEMITLQRETQRQTEITAQLRREMEGVGDAVFYPWALSALAGGGITTTTLPDPDGGGGGGRGGGARGNTRLDSLIDSLQTERETVEEWRAESLSLLQNANERELEALGGFNEARLRLEQEYQDRLQGIRKDGDQSQLSQLGGFFGEMANATAQGGEQLLKVSQKFSAAQALINSWEAYTEALKDPNISVFGRLAAAASVLSAGLGAVSAIRSVSSSGGPTGGAGAAAAPARTSQAAVIQLEGEIFGRDQVIKLINQINESVEDGATIRVA